MNIPKELLEEAVEASGAPTQTMAVVMGLQELIKKKKIKKLLNLRGSNAIELTHNDLKRMRKR